MASTNSKIKYETPKTHEGGIASRITPFEELKRTIMTCLLWEDGFYENGIAIADRVISLLDKVSENDARNLLYIAKNENKLRHMPLFLLVQFAKKGWLTKDDVNMVCTRVDDMTELLSLYWKDGKKPLPKQMVKGLQMAFSKFDEYQFAKYNRDKAVKVKDVMKMVRPKPEDKTRAELWGKVINDSLATPDTWEVAISAAKSNTDKKEAFERLMTEKKLGDLAFVRNLRKMDEVGVSSDIIKKSFESRKWNHILPFQFVTSARYSPKYETNLESAMLNCLKEHETINMKTKLLVDVSGSMNDKLSAKSETTRLDVANGLAILLREVTPDIEVYSFSDNSKLVPARRGFALRDSIQNSQRHGGTNMWTSVREVGSKERSNLMIIITDEQTSGKGSYVDANTDFFVIINVASNQNGVSYDKNTLHVSGWSENVVAYLQEYLKSMK